MAGDAHGAETQEESQTAQDLGYEQAQEEQPQVSGVDWEKAIAERDERIAALEQQVADAADRVGNVGVRANRPDW